MDFKRVKKKIHKYYEFAITKVVLMYQQKRFTYGNVKLKYILQRSGKSDDLVIVFSSCTRKGIRARYNYMRTLSGIPANKLFVLDDFAKDRRGSYYLGKNWTFSEEKATVSLIESISEALNISGKTLFCGSSKGGYSALNFGLMFDSSYIIAGAPQYYLANYLMSSGNIDCLNHIIGQKTEDKINQLNFHLKNRIMNNEKAIDYHIYLNYSDKEHTFEEHISNLINDLYSAGFVVNSRIESFTNHSEISLFFPDFLRETINDILNN